MKFRRGCECRSAFKLLKNCNPHDLYKTWRFFRKVIGVNSIFKVKIHEWTTSNCFMFLFYRYLIHCLVILVLTISPVKKFHKKIPKNLSCEIFTFMVKNDQKWPKLILKWFSRRSMINCILSVNNVCSIGSRWIN